ncbi:MAG: hypothetical protein ACT443_02870 [Gemmatimonadota bacterium]
MIGRVLFIAVVLACAGVAQAQQASRTLHWRSLDVVAQLDADGRLHASALTFISSAFASRRA